MITARKVYTIIGIVVLVLTLIHIEHRVSALERVSGDFVRHFGYRCHFPFVGEFGVEEETK